MTDDETPPLTPELLRKVGTALYGEVWIVPLAFDAAVSVRAMERWAAGTHDPPAGLVYELVTLCQYRATMVRNLAVLYAKRAEAMDQAAIEVARSTAKRLT